MVPFQSSWWQQRTIVNANLDKPGRGKTSEVDIEFPPEVNVFTFILAILNTVDTVIARFYRVAVSLKVREIA